MPVPVFSAALCAIQRLQTPRWIKLNGLSLTSYLMCFPAGLAASRLIHPLLLISSLGACSLPIPLSDPVSRAQITSVQSCAIGYDLARLIHRHISLRETVIIAPNRGTPCETRALHYLRLSGFAVDDTGRSAGSRNTPPGFDVALTPRQDGTIDAVATVAGTLHIARRYRLAETGVYPVSAASIGALPAPYQRRSQSSGQRMRHYVSQSQYPHTNEDNR